VDRQAVACAYIGVLLVSEHKIIASAYIGVLLVSENKMGSSLQYPSSAFG